MTVGAGNREQLAEAVPKAKEKFELPEAVPGVSCYEAGRDGFWLHRYLLSIGIENQVVDSLSIEVHRRQRRAKTDRIDGDKLLTMLMRYCGGEWDLWRVVQVPSVEVEDARQLHRGLERLKKERTGHRNRIQGLLVGPRGTAETAGGFSGAFRENVVVGRPRAAEGSQAERRGSRSKPMGVRCCTGLAGTGGRWIVQAQDPQGAMFGLSVQANANSAGQPA